MPSKKEMLTVPADGTDEELRDAFLNGISERAARSLRKQQRQYLQNDALANRYRQPIEAWLQMRESFDYFEFESFLVALGGLDFDEYEGEFTFYASDEGEVGRFKTNFILDEETMVYRRI